MVRLRQDPSPVWRAIRCAVSVVWKGIVVAR
jgi:hypothetical protein